MVLKERNVRMSNDDKKRMIQDVYRSEYRTLCQDVIEKTKCSFEEAQYHCARALQHALNSLSQCPLAERGVFNWIRGLALFHQHISVQLRQHFFSWQPELSNETPHPYALPSLEITHTIQDTLQYARNNIFQVFYPEINPAVTAQIGFRLQKLFWQRIAVRKLNQLFNANYTQFKNIARLLQHQPTDDYDLVNDAYIRATQFLMRDPDHTLPDEARFVSWMKSIMRHVHLDEQRKLPTNTAIESLEHDTFDQGSPAASLPDTAVDIEKQATDAEAQQELEMLIQKAKIDEHHRIIVRLSLLYGLTNQEIADRLKVNVETVRSIIKRIRPVILRQFPARLLDQYLQKAPYARLKLLACINDYMATEKSDVKTIRQALTLHVSGMDVPDIVRALPEGSISIESIQQLLKKHLPKLFKTFYNREETDARKGESNGTK